MDGSGSHQRGGGGQRPCTMPPCLSMCRSWPGPSSEGSEQQTRWTGSWIWTRTRRLPLSTPGSDISSSSSASCFGWVQWQLTLVYIQDWCGWETLKEVQCCPGVLIQSKSTEANTRSFLVTRWEPQDKNGTSSPALFYFWVGTVLCINSICIYIYLLLQHWSLGLVVHSYQTVLSQATSDTPANLVVNHLHPPRFL